MGRCSIRSSPFGEQFFCIRIESVRVDIITGAAETREGANALLEKYHDPRLADRVFELAWTHSHVVLQHLNAAETDAQLYGRLAGSVVYPTALRRANPSIIARNRRGQNRVVGIWNFRRPADRARARARSGGAQSRASGGAGARVLAEQGIDRRSGDLERRSLGLPAKPSRDDHQPAGGESRSGAARQAGRGLRAARRTAFRGRSRAPPGGGARHSP